MMSKKQWFTGMIFYTLYLFIGAVFYYVSESNLEREKRLNYRRERIEIFNLLHQHYTTIDPGDGDFIMGRLEEYCGRPVTNTSLEDDASDGPYKWNYFNSFLFAITVTTTVGYGNLAPTSDAGRMWMILYALIGIPATGILLATLGEFFSIVILRIKDRYKRERIETRLGLIGDIAMYILMGIFAFIFLPACAFVYMEQWSWGLAIYYAFVTVSTVGFGDYVAAQQPELGHGEAWFTVYRVFLIFWIIFGLGYYFMILAYLTRGLRSKKLLQLEHKLAKNLKETQSRVWQGVTRDIGYLRRVLNEVYLQRLKPVYRDEDEIRATFDPRKRSSSCPDLSISINEDEERTYGVWRRRANSEALHISIPRIMSENDLQRIDKDATFRTASLIEPVDLLVHVVEALGSNGYINEDDGGIDGFSDEDILASEGWSSIQDDGSQRARAASEVRIPMDDVSIETPGDAQWTWSGVPTSRHIHELMRARQKRRNTTFNEDDTKSTKSQSLLERWHASKQRHKAKSLGSLFLNRQRSGSLQPAGPPPVYTQQNYKTHTTGVRPTMPSIIDTGDVDSMLEETSIAEFLRALTSLHSRVGAGALDSHSISPTSRTAALPSLLNLFSPLPGAVQTNRRFSLRRVSSPITALPGGNRRPSLRSTTTPTPPPTSDSFTPPPSQGRRFSLRHATPPPSYTPPSSLGGGPPRRSSLKPTGSPGSSGRHQFSKQAPLRPRFKIGPYNDAEGSAPPPPTKVPRSRHDTS